MAKSIPAIVTPEVLQWARGLDRITLGEIAQKLNVEVAKVEAWENGSEYPTLPQAKALAKQLLPRMYSQLRLETFCL